MTDDFNPQAPSQGLGDTVAKITHALGIDKVANAVAKAVGAEDCGCEARRRALNRIVPYKQSTPAPITTPVDPTLYLYEGVREFEMLTSVSAKIKGQTYSYQTGEIISVSNTDPFYILLRNLLSSHAIRTYQKPK